MKENDTNLTTQNIKDNHSRLVEEFSQELDRRKKIKQEYEGKEEEKNGLIKKCEEDKNFLAKIPQHIQKISDSCKPLQHLYKTGVSTNYDQIQVRIYYACYNENMLDIKESSSTFVLAV